MSEVNIGDLKGQEKGTAARNNAGKPAWSYMPLGQISFLMYTLEWYAAPPQLEDLTKALGDFQAQGTSATAYRVLELGTRYLMHATNTDFDEAMHQVIKVWQFGEKEYARYNWMKGMLWSEALNSAQRHVMHMYNGVEIDNDSKEHHAAHFICNAMMLVHFVKHYPEGNDLPVKWFN